MQGRPRPVEKIAEHLVLSRIVVAEVVRLVDEHDLWIEVFQMRLEVEADLAQLTDAEHMRTEVVFLAHVLPHGSEWRGRDDQRA